MEIREWKLIHLLTAVLALLLAGSTLRAQEHQAAERSNPIELMAGLGELHHPIATENADAQRFFDQGLTLVYAFNHADAERSFRRAAELDPKSPMPWWGMALAAGPNYNADVDPEREKTAYDAIQTALLLAKNAPEHEQAYCDALAERYTNDAKADYQQLAMAYSRAMRKLADRYADDPDAVTLYAESLMDLHPWRLWSNDGKPGPDTEEITKRLEAVLRAYPDHIGANHFYIHAEEASPHPERALPSADRLQTLAPAAGHLVHMPSHIYSRTGDYQKAVASNIAGTKADERYVEQTGTHGSLYHMMYFTHNLHFLSAACAMEGNSACALANADKMVQHVTPGVKQMAMLEGFLAWQPFMLARFGKWEAILDAPEPDAALAINDCAWHYARALAYANKNDARNLAAERKELEELVDKLAPEAPFGLNLAKPVMMIAIEVLDGKAAALNGDADAALSHYRKAVTLQDELKYDEPPDWYYPVRETLGAALLLNGNARGAELVFREDLVRNPRNPRSLDGLSKALEQQKRSSEAEWVKSQFAQAWAHADVELNLADY